MRKDLLYTGEMIDDDDEGMLMGDWENFEFWSAWLLMER